jgi:hypothetical protein
MEFERAIYRVYERCLEGLREEQDQDQDGGTDVKSCIFLEYLCLFCAAVLFLFLLVLHAAFVGSSGGLPELLSTGRI